MSPLNFFTNRTFGDLMDFSFHSTESLHFENIFKIIYYTWKTFIKIASTRLSGAILARVEGTVPFPIPVFSNLN